MQQTSAAQGDFAKTADGLANSTRIVNAQLQDTLATLGEKLLPIALKGATAVKYLLEAFAGLPAPMQDAIIAFAGLAAAAGPVLTIGGKLVGVYGSLSAQLPKLIGGMRDFSNVLRGMSLASSLPVDGNHCILKKWGRAQATSEDRSIWRSQVTRLKKPPPRLRFY
jgi:hypothetical protein